MKVYVIGSIFQETQIEIVADKLRTLGFEVRYVKPSDKPLKELIHDCFLTIESWADVVVAVPKIYPALTFGDGTMYEMEHARSFGKPVFIYSE